jgi:hypothetical protein
MKMVIRQGAQGDVLFTKVDRLPQDAKLTKVEPGAQGHVVAHSETGHHHIVPEAAVAHFSTQDPLVDFLEVPDTGASVIHLRDFDTHESLGLPGGIWEVTRQREDSPEGWRPAMD